MFDYMIVGAGFAGSVLAERLATQQDATVLVIDKRNHIAGNAYDFYNDAGILVHKYGPHIFHTNSEKVFEYLSRFTAWRPYEHRVLTSVDGQLVPMPINADTLNKLYGLNLTCHEVDEYLAKVAEPRDQIRTSEDVVVSRVGRDLYEKFFRNYTRKQWNLDPSELDASVTARVPVRTTRDDRYFTDRFQAMPLHGYTRMFEKMLDHPNIKIMLNTEYADIKDEVRFRQLIFTGPVDEYFDYCYGKLPYRSLHFEHQTHDKVRYQEAAVVNYPNEQPTPASPSSSTSPARSTQRPASSSSIHAPKAIPTTPSRSRRTPSSTQNTRPWPRRCRTSISPAAWERTSTTTWIRWSPRH